MTQRRKVTKELGILFSEKALSILLGLGTTFLAYRLLSPAGYGAVGVLEAAFALSASVVGFRTTESLTRCLVEFREKKLPVSSLIKLSLTIDLATQSLAILLVAITTFVAREYFMRLGVTFDLVVLFGLCNLCTFPQKSYTSLIREKRAFPYMAKASLISKLCLLAGLCVLFVCQIASVKAYFATVLFSRLFQLGFMVTFIGCYKASRDTGNVVFSNPFSAFLNPLQYWNDSRYHDYWYFLKMGFLTSSLSGLIKNGSDMLLIGHFGNAADVGHYKLAKSLAEKVQLAPSLLAPYYFQDFSEWVVRGEYGKLRSFLKRFASYWSPTVAGICLAAFIVCKPVILTLFGENSLATVNHFRILLAGMFIQIVLFWVQPLVLSLKLLTAQFFAVLFVTVGYFTIIFFAEPAIGVYAVSSALAFAWGGGYLYLLLALQRKRELLRGV